jgi:hypothetical protein
VANNGAARNAFRSLASAVRAIPETLGVRGTKVTIRLRTYTAPVGESGATATSTDIVLSPIPKVSQVSEGQRGYFGGGVLASSTGELRVGDYEVGPITQDFPGGGYSPSDLAPAGGASKRVTVLLEGDEFASGGEEFEVVQMDATHPFRTMLLVRRVRQGA